MLEEGLRGTAFMLELPRLETAMKQLFMDEFSHTDSAGLSFILTDRKILDRDERWAVGLSAKNNERSQPTNQARTE